MVFALAFAVELLPPFAEEVELGIVVDQNLNFLAGLVECVAGLRLCERCVVFAFESGTLHAGCACNEGFDVEPCYGYGQQAHGCED